MVKQAKFPALKNDLILRASKGEVVERVPVWIMRQVRRVCKLHYKAGILSQSGNIVPEATY